MFSIHDKVSWTEDKKIAVSGTEKYIIQNHPVTGIIVDELHYDYYLVKRDDTGECEKLCYRKLRKTNG